MPGIFIIVLLAGYALIFGAVRLFKKDNTEMIFSQVRQRLARGIIHTAAVKFTFQTVGVLAVIVLIRTFLSFTLEVELNKLFEFHTVNPRSCHMFFMADYNYPRKSGTITCEISPLFVARTGTITSETGGTV